MSLAASEYAVNCSHERSIYSWLPLSLPYGDYVHHRRTFTVTNHNATYSAILQLLQVIPAKDYDGLGSGYTSTRRLIPTVRVFESVKVADQGVHE